jgi:hypothetical protein
MHVDNPIVAAEFDGRVPKSQQPRPESDWATVDIDAGPRQVVVLGCVLNGDSRHELACRDVSIDDTGELTRLSVTVQLEKHDPEGEVILTAPESSTTASGSSTRARLPANTASRTSTRTATSS